MLQKQGIIVDLIGRFNNNMQIVDAEFYNKYDAIIGIGKNVKYSLVSGIPFIFAVDLAVRDIYRKKYSDCREK